MKFLALLAVLAFEQVRPLRHGNRIHVLFARYARHLERRLNGGQYAQGVTAWLIAVVPAVAVVQAVNLTLLQLSTAAAILWNVAVLYVTMGLRQFSHYFTQITQALREEKLEVARDQLGAWRGRPAAGFAAEDVARVAIELALIASHRQVFGSITWFIVAGAPGAVLYRLAAMLAERWGARRDAEFGAFGQFARRCFFWLDWLPARLTAATFAIVGNFEDAVYCWRTQAASWTCEANEVIVATGGGALGARLGGTLNESGGAEFRPELGVGDEADADYMRSAVGLVWRALALWMFLVLVVSIAHALG